MASFNKVILIGNMTADPEIKQTQSGVSVCSFSIAVNRRIHKENDNLCDFINIVAWRNTAEFVSRYFRKGNPILICGQLQTRSWTDNQGNKRTSLDVVADEVSFVAPAQNTAPEREVPTSTVPNPTQWGRGNTSNPPVQMEAIPNDETLPF